MIDANIMIKSRHAIHPAAVFGVFLVTSGVLFLSLDVFFQASCLVCAATVYVLAARSVTRAYRVAALGARLFLYVSCFYFLFATDLGGEVWWTWPWGAQVSAATLKGALAVSARLVALLFLSATMVTVVSPSALSRGLTQIGVPFAISFLVLLAAQMHERFSSDWASIRDGLASRYAVLRLDRPNRRNLQILGLLASTFVLLSLLQVNQIYASAEIRGLQSGLLGRTQIDVYRWRVADTLAVAASCVVALSVWRFLR